MKCVRTHRSPLALLLAGLVLLAALACSAGHGQVLAAFVSVSGADICGPEGQGTQASAGHPAAHGEHALFMQLALFDCAFASKLSTALVSFVALGWLLRVLRRRALMPESLAWAPNRHDSPGRVAQAP